MRRRFLLKEEGNYKNKYLTFVASNSGTFKFSGNSISYSTDSGNTWNTLASNTNSPTISAGSKILWKATLTPSSKGIGKFSSSGSFTVEGNIMSLLYGDNFIDKTSLSGKNYAFSSLFSGCTHLLSAKTLVLPATTLANSCYSIMFNGCTSLTTAPQLPATTLANGCYNGMFSGCTSLTTAPQLPATTLANDCYNSMFYNCTSLTTAPQLLATTLASYCYSNMFYLCTSLTTAPRLLATTLANYCYYNMFYGCTSLTTAPQLPATTLADFCYLSMFRGCTSLTTAPQLPATTLERYCYSYMFQGCTSLTTAPTLLATTLANGCYNGMFGGCTSLTTAPQLPATTLESYCYNGMFSGCTSLTTAPQLLATTLADSCYSSMFQGCTNLTTAPQLPATTLATDCYLSMFQGCTSLTTAPELPATTLANGCYNGMFSGCTSLTTAPELLATTLASYCYSNMFSNCAILNRITCLATDISATNCTANWVDGVASSGTFLKDYDTNWTIGNNGIPNGWVVKNYQDEEYLTFVASNSGTFKFSGNSISYSTDNGNTWNTLASNTNSPTISAGSKILWKATLTPSSNGIGRFASTSNFTVEGNIMSLLYGDNFIDKTSLSGKNYAFSNLFRGCTSLTSAENLSLPATTLAANCYNGMFYGCTSLTTAPQLPATTLANSCYSGMFNGCTSLTTAPQLPATTLANACYSYMFSSCTSLTTAPQLPATTLADYCYQYMFSSCTSLCKIICYATNLTPTHCTLTWVTGVASSGTFLKDCDINWTIGNNGIPNGWTSKDVNVNLGLPSGIKWSTMNVGSDSEVDSGLYFQWGDVDGYAGYGSTLPNYSDTKGYYLTGNIASNKEYDAARNYMGGTWRIPSEQEFSELINNCSSTRTDIDGVNGILLTSTHNGKSIFFPLSGYMEFSSLVDNNSCGYYFSSTFVDERYAQVLYLGMSTENIYISTGFRSNGLTIRAVQ